MYRYAIHTALLSHNQIAYPRINDLYRPALPTRKPNRSAHSSWKPHALGNLSPL